MQHHGGSCGSFKGALKPDRLRRSYSPLLSSISGSHSSLQSAGSTGGAFPAGNYSNDKDTDLISCSHNPIYCTFQASVNINIQFHKSKITPLHMAIHKSRWSVVECLVGWGALLNVVDCDGNTPLHILITSRSVKDPGSPQIEQVN